MSLLLTYLLYNINLLLRDQNLCCVSGSMEAPEPQAIRLPLTALNHISLVVADVMSSRAFYSSVLGFMEVKRPHALQESFAGAW